MPRLSRFQIMQHMKPLIAQYFDEMSQNVFSFQDISNILNENKTKWMLSTVTTANDFLHFLMEKNIINDLEIAGPQRKINKYITKNASIYELAVSINKSSYLSHYSAMFLHGLTNNIPKWIYTNTEQRNKDYYYDNEKELEQENIDLAFSRPMRTTNQIAKIDFNRKKYSVFLLNGKSHSRLGIVDYQLDNNSIVPVTSMERTLIDIAVRPNYSGGVAEVLNAYKLAKGIVSVNRITALLQKMNFIYPYHQVIGFYLERAGYKESVLSIFDQFEIKHKFYLTYQMNKKEFSDRWKVYYPKDQV